jgi:hypothetical protein
MRIAASASFSLAALALVSLSSLAGCEGPAPLVPADAVPATDVWIDTSDGWKVGTDDGLSVQGPKEIGNPAAAVRVPGGVWVCGDAGIAAYDAAAGAWKISSFKGDFPGMVKPTCKFDAASLTEATLYADTSNYWELKQYFCHPDGTIWRCAETSAYDPYSLVVTEGKTWIIDSGIDVVAVYDESGSRSFPLGGYLYGGLQRVPGSNMVIITVDDHILELDGTGTKEIHVDDPYGSMFSSAGGRYPVVPLGPEHYYSIASHTSDDEDCHYSWSDSGCTVKAVHWSEVTVVEVTDGGSSTLASHREEGVAWAASGRMVNGELRVQAGDHWYRLP